MTNLQLFAVAAFFLAYAYLSRTRITVVNNDRDDVGGSGTGWMIAIFACIGLIIMAQSKGCAPTSFDGSDKPKERIEIPEQPTLDSAATPKPGFRKQIETPPPATRKQFIIVVDRFQPDQIAQADRLATSIPAWNMEVMNGNNQIWVIVRVATARQGQRLIDTWRREVGGLEDLELRVIEAVL